MMRGGRQLQRFVSWRPQSHIEPGTILEVEHYRTLLGTCRTRVT